MDNIGLDESGVYWCQDEWGLRIREPALVGKRKSLRAFVEVLHRDESGQPIVKYTAETWPLDASEAAAFLATIDPKGVLYHDLLRLANETRACLIDTNTIDSEGIDAPVGKEWPRLDDAALYGLIGDIVRIIGPHTESDPVALLAQALVCFGNSIGRTAFYLQEADRHYMNLFCVLVGQTSKARKGTSASHITRLFKLAHSDGNGQSHADEWGQGNVASGLSSGEGLIWAVRDQIERQEPIKEKGHVVDYQTVIADPGVQDKRLMILEPEFVRVLRVIERDGNTLSAIIRDAWDHGNLRSMTKGNVARSTDAHISIVGHITGQELRKRLGDIEIANGFANRFIFLAVKRSKLLPDGGWLKKEVLAALAKRLRESIEFARQVEQITRSQEARVIWHKNYTELSQSHPGAFGSLTSRAEAQVLRLSCIYALMDKTNVVAKPHLEAALALWRYSEASVKYVFGESTGDETADKILSLVQAKTEGVTLSEVQAYFNRHLKATDMRSAIAELIEAGLIEEGKRAGSGRPSTVLVATTPSKGSEESEESEGSFASIEKQGVVERDGLHEGSELSELSPDEEANLVELDEFFRNVSHEERKNSLNENNVLRDNSHHSLFSQTSTEEQSQLLNGDDVCPKCGSLAMSKGKHMACTVCPYTWG